MGSRILYYGVIIPISLLPHPLLYALSNFVYLVMYRLIGYRKEVVSANLRGAFPDRSADELNKIERKFYRHFCDLVLESLKNFTISERQASKRMHHINPEVINDYAAQGRSTILSGGHYNNWELWAVEAGTTLDPLIVGIYKRLSNAYFDKKMRDTRGRHGLKLIPTKEVAREMENLKGTITTSVYAIDQSPANPKRAYWMNFLGRETACFYGPEKYAQKDNSPVIFAHTRKVKRGYYEVEYEVVFDQPENTEYGEIIRTVNRMLEKDIREVPEYWLWTHRRWKHTRPEGNELDQL